MGGDLRGADRGKHPCRHHIAYLSDTPTHFLSMASVVSEAGLGVASANLSGWKSRESAEAIETIARKIAETDGGDLRGCQWEALSKNRRKKLWRKAEIIYLRESGG